MNNFFCFHVLNNFYCKNWVGSCLNTGKHIVLEVSFLSEEKEHLRSCKKQLSRLLK